MKRLWQIKKQVKTNESVTLSYVGKEGEGKVSRALIVKDPEMLYIPGDIQVGKTYSYALWFKVEKFGHDKQGTNLINKKYNIRFHGPTITGATYG